MELPPRRIAGTQVHFVSHMATDISDQTGLKRIAIDYIGCVSILKMKLT